MLSDKLCHQLGTMEGTCKLMLPSVVPQLLQKLNDGADAGMCSFACKKSLAQQVREAFTPVEEAVQRDTPLGDSTCDICELAVGKLHDYTTSKAFQGQVTDLAKKFCEKLGDSASQCKTFLPLFLPALEQKLNDFLSDGELACSKVGAC